MVDQGFYRDNNNTFLRTISSQFDDGKTAFILQNMNYLILNPRDLVLSDKVTPVEMHTITCTDSALQSGSSTLCLLISHLISTV